MEVLKASISFLTTIPIKGDIEKLRRNLWIFPYCGVLIGLTVASVTYLLNFLDLSFLGIVAYVLVEGINHIDGLADFGDAFFAPKSKKIQALKDTKIGAGGVIFVVLYLLTLYHGFLKANFVNIVLAQTLAKFCMLILITTSKPSWEGIASYIMEYAKKRDLAIASLTFIPFLLLNPIKFFRVFIISIAVALIVKYYSEKTFNGVSGDVLGAVNCIVFAVALTFS